MTQLFRRILFGLAILCSGPVLADGIDVLDAYAISTGPGAPVAAAYMVIRNDGTTDDRLIGVESDAAARVALHTHIVDDNGTMQMRPVDQGLPLPAGGTATLERGGDHIMLMGLRRPLNPGATLRLTLIFEQAGPITIEAPVQDAAGN
jgi:copper(I)-binding protein